MAFSQSLELIVFVLAVAAGPLFVGIIIYFGFFRGRALDKDNPAEIAGRAVLIGTFSATSFMLMLQFAHNLSIPDVPEAILILDALAVAIYVVIQLLASADAGREGRLRLMQAQQKSLEHPNNISYAWNLAAASLENYLDRNLSQVKWIFNIAVLVMICGFAIIGYGVSLAMTNKVEASIATSASGLLTQFISVTLMVIYRSTMSQATSFVSILERLNNVGIAVQLLDKMPDESLDLKNETRATILRSLIVSNMTGISSTGKSGPEVEKVEVSAANPTDTQVNPADQP